MEPRGLPRLLMHLANVLVILFIMLPIVAVVLGSLQSEKTLQGESRRVIPSEWTLDNFTVILTQGQQKGRIFEQATYLPDNIKSFYRAFANSTDRRARRDLADGRVRRAVGLHGRPPEAALGALADAGQCGGALPAGDRADDSALRGRCARSGSSIRCTP